MKEARPLFTLNAWFVIACVSIIELTSPKALLFGAERKYEPDGSLYVIVDGSDPEDSGPVYVNVNDTVPLRAMLDPDDPGFTPPDPDWTVIEGEYDEPLSDGEATTSITPSVPGLIGVQAQAAQGRDAIKIICVTVSFDSATIRTGFAITPTTQPVNATTQPAISKHLRALVEPKSEATSVSINVTGINRISISNLHKDATAGTIDLDITGTSATPSTQPAGDTKIEASVGAVVFAEVNVIVIVPASIGTPHDQPNSVVIGYNVLWDGRSSPAAPCPANKKVLASYYAHYLTIQVLDQFGDDLDSMYTGSRVIEVFPGGATLDINQTINTSGAYSDPCGTYALPANELVDEDSIEAEEWPEAETLLPTPKDDTYNLGLLVAGHPLNPAIANRRMIVTIIGGDVNIQIIWP